MPRQQIRLGIGDVCELAFDGVGDTSVECPPRLAQQGAVGRILHQGMLEKVGRVWRHALVEQQTGSVQTVE